MVPSSTLLTTACVIVYFCQTASSLPPDLHNMADANQIRLLAQSSDKAESNASLVSHNQSTVRTSYREQNLDGIDSQVSLLSGAKEGVRSGQVPVLDSLPQIQPPSQSHFVAKENSMTKYHGKSNSERKMQASTEGAASHKARADGLEPVETPFEPKLTVNYSQDQGKHDEFKIQASPLSQRISGSNLDRIRNTDLKHESERNLTHEPRTTLPETRIESVNTQQPNHQAETILPDNKGPKDQFMNDTQQQNANKVNIGHIEAESSVLMKNPAITKEFIDHAKTSDEESSREQKKLDDKNIPKMANDHGDRELKSFQNSALNSNPAGRIDSPKFSVKPDIKSQQNLLAANALSPLGLAMKVAKAPQKPSPSQLADTNDQEPGPSDEDGTESGPEKKLNLPNSQLPELPRAAADSVQRPADDPELVKSLFNVTSIPIEYALLTMCIMCVIILLLWKRCWYFICTVCFKRRQQPPTNVSGRYKVAYKPL